MLLWELERTRLYKIVNYISTEYQCICTKCVVQPIFDMGTMFENRKAEFWMNLYSSVAIEIFKKMSYVRGSHGA